MSFKVEKSLINTGNDIQRTVYHLTDTTNSSTAIVIPSRDTASCPELDDMIKRIFTSNGIPNQRYEVSITETLRRGNITVIAESTDDAIDSIKELYSREVFILDAGDHEGTKFEARNESSIYWTVSDKR